MNTVKNKREKFAIEEKHPQKRSKWLFLIPCILLFCQMYSYVLGAYVLNQYSYYSAMTTLYGNRSHFRTSGQSECNTNRSSEQYQQQVVVTKLTSDWATYCIIASNLPAVFVTLNYASYSDVYGRRWFFVLPFVGLVIKNVLSMIGIHLLLLVNWFWIFFVAEGITGIWISTLSIAFCFVSDTTEPGKWRSIAIGIVEMCIGLGSLLAAFTSGYLIKAFKGFLQPMGFALVVSVLGLILSIVLIPETLSKEKRRKSIKCYDQPKAVFMFYFSNVSQVGKRWMYIICMLIFISSVLANLGKLNIEAFYQLNQPFCWSSLKLGYYGAVRTLTNQILGMALIRVFQWCTQDEMISLFGLVTAFASLVLEGFANTDVLMYLVPVIGAGSFMTMPMIRSIMSKITPPDRQGAMYSGIAAMEAVCNMVGLVAANEIYGSTVGVFRGLVFFVMASYILFGVILNILLIIGIRRTTTGNIAITPL